MTTQQLQIQKCVDVVGNAISTEIITCYLKGLIFGHIIEGNVMQNILTMSTFLLLNRGTSINADSSRADVHALATDNLGLRSVTQAAQLSELIRP